MTAPSSAGLPAVTAIGPARLFAGYDGRSPVPWANHIDVHGVMKTATRSELEQACLAVGLLGRGGAAFPVARKLAALPRRVHAVVVNGSESEPFSWKDRTLLTTVPHLVLDGAAAVADAVRARVVVVTVHDPRALAVIVRAIGERPDRRRIHVDHRPGHGFVAGEARSVLRAASGGPAKPTGRRTLPSDRGLEGRPTFLSNVETFAQLALLLRIGPTTYAERGVADEPGTSAFTAVGAVARPGVIESANGLPLPLLLEVVGAEPEAAVLIGGYHGMWAPVDNAVTLSRPALAQVGLTLGAGVIGVMSQRTCPLGEVAAIAEWLGRQSAGQCGPCVFGLPSIAHDLDRVLAGDRSAYADLERHLGMVVGRGACAHPDGVSRLVASSLRRFVDDVREHLEWGSCGRQVLGELSPSRHSPVRVPRPPVGAS
jgi:NADH:ubiquinone oxidoreductase subunit F (NADH-binding)